MPEISVNSWIVQSHENPFHIILVGQFAHRDAPFAVKIPYYLKDLYIQLSIQAETARIKNDS